MTENKKHLNKEFKLEGVQYVQASRDSISFLKLLVFGLERCRNEKASSCNKGLRAFYPGRNTDDADVA